MSEKNYKVKNQLEQVSDRSASSTLDNQESLSNFEPEDGEPLDEATLKIMKKTQDFIT